MARALKFLFLLSFVSFSTERASSQDLPAATDDAAEMSAPAVPAEEATSDATPDIREERQRVFQLLKTEIEPNLVKGDIEKLQRNVKSLGSYRREWVEKARETLVANPALSEFYLYRFVPLKNRRLNAEILATLLEFPTFREPRATIAFANDLAKTPQEKVGVLRLLEKAVLQDAHLATEAVQYVASGWGQDIPLDERLRFASAICGRLNSTQVHSTLEAWIQSTSGFWEKVMADELRACLKGN